MIFHPTPERERSQVRIFSGADAIETPFDAVYIRLNPDDFDRLVSSRQLVEAPVDPTALQEAERIFREDSPKSYSLELGDLSGDAWSLVPTPRDFVAEIHTRRFETLTYSRNSSAREDISLFERRRRRTVALYSSPLNDQGMPLAGEASTAGFTVEHYDIDVTVIPERRWIEGEARLAIRAGTNPVTSLTLRLAEPLVVQSVVSDQYGRLFSMRVREQGSLVVSLPDPLLRGSELSLTVRYGGRLDPQPVELSESMARGQFELPPPSDPSTPFDDPEPSYLFSSQVIWYPRPAASHYATAALKITVPEGLECVASGEPEPDSPVAAPATSSRPASRTFAFRATQPLRYLAFVISRLRPAEEMEITFPPRASGDSDRPAGTLVDALRLTVTGNPGHGGRGRDVAERAADIVRFYRSLLDDSPYPELAVALLENTRPGGHSPGYFAVLNQPPRPTPFFAARDDPASFDRFPDFILAHELAHQWWGHAVGWRSYHDQWLSEGFAQYFAALYAERQRGDDGPEVFRDLMREMRDWAIQEADAGPISLGSRLGHIQGDSRIFRAVVYNKGAVVLQMLRELVGDDPFFAGLRRFYRTSRFRSVGTADFMAAMETEADRPLSRFFERWVYGWTLPRITFGSRVEGEEVVLHFEQLGEVFDVPVTVTLQYANRPAVDVIVPVTDAVVDMRIPLAGPLRRATISSDIPPLAIVTN
jgi:hypothetical protein